NAVIQALLIWPDVQVTDWLPMIALALVSAIAFMLAYGAVAATALQVPEGVVRPPQVVPIARANGVRYALWSLGLLLLTIVGLALYAVPGIVILAVTPFLLIAAIDGRPNPLLANFRTIGMRFWRYLSVLIVTGVLIGAGTLAAGATNFFVRGPVASFAVWLVGGLVLAWFTTAWALVYRSANEAERAEIANH
ncbi:MAG: hypothetical protein PSX37_04690, partial [bacterium]|nr:hypothetical protein [bacterium]